MMDLGKAGERLVAEYYQKQGFKLLESNYIFPFGKRMGELDLVLTKDNELVFVEVKTRRNSRFGTPFDAIDQSKRRKLVKMAKLYLLKHPQFDQFGFRIDVAAVDIDNQDNPVIILTNAIEDLD